ncbi:unnamed protein product [Nippostrongylus brasiliensis]|uniref:Kinesin-associated protein 3 (inferred by orthology to a human protein) n=1 Tax=Nippostrongylus brasiliensis TaxID=27835 RepID=A0A158R382_NIPBR|nr:unnamed protein product [Nippostrongylus brasiliensis]
MSSSSLRADMDQVDSYIELFYEDAAEKNRGALLILELTKTTANLEALIENETLIGALARVFREDWKRNFDLATTIVRIFVQFSYYNQFQPTLLHHKVGAVCMNAMEYELKRSDLWAAEAKNAELKTASKCQLAIRKQQTLLAGKENVPILLSTIGFREMVRRDVVPMLLRCLSFRDSAELTLATVQLLLKLSIFEENKVVMEQGDVIGKLLQLFPIGDVELRRVTIRLLFNLSFDAKSRRRMVSEGLVAHVVPLIESDAKALNLLYQLSVNDDAKAMLTFTDAMQLLMRDLLTGIGSEATKAVLLNACAEKRNAQLVCGHDGQGLALLLDAAIDGRDLMVAKIIRSIAYHEGPTQDVFVSSMSRLLETGLKNAVMQEDEYAALGLCNTFDLVNWMSERLKASAGENEPLQLQVLALLYLKTMQEDDEFVVQLLYLFLQLLRHRELANRLMGSDSALGAYVIDLMHDKNPAIREMCDNALVIIGEHSQEWARRIAGERFRWHNAQWLDTIEGGVACDEGAVMDEDYVPGMMFDDQFDDAWLWESARHAQLRLHSIYQLSISVLMSAMWISIFALCSLLSTLYSMTITHKPMEKFSYGLARVPVLAVFSTTVLAQLFSIFLSKESFEHLLSPGHQGAHDASAAHEHEVEAVGSWPYFVGAAASSAALLLSAYALKNQPFQHVLTASSSSSLQEHAADICHAICWVVPGLSRLLLPRINSMVLLAAVTSTMLVLCEHFRHDFAWADPVCCLVLSVAVFSTMWPLSSYTGMILLQTAPPHLLNQIDRCISEASTIDGVLEIRSRHFWQLDFGQLVGTMDVRVRRDADEQNVLTLVTDKMSSVVSTLTVQIVKDAAWQTLEGSNTGLAHTHDTLVHAYNDNHGHSHSHGNHGHSHDHGVDNHGHSHSHGGE